MAKKKSSPSPDEMSPTFETALADLQTIVGQLEEGSLGLEEALQQYEQGTSLLRHCYQVLTTAEQKIEQLTGFNSEGEAECEPFDASATLTQREQTAGRRSQSSEKNSREPAAEAPTAKPQGKLFSADSE